MADESAIAIPDAEQPAEQPATQPAPPHWYPFPELAQPLEALRAQCAGLDRDAARVRHETAATLDALIAETEQGFDRLRAAHAVIAELDDDQAAAVLHRIRDKAKAKVGDAPEADPDPPAGDAP